MRATIADLRFRTHRLLRAVERGEEVLITDRGKACARLVPVERTRCGGEHAVALFGLWKDRPDMADVDGYVDAVRRDRP